MAPREFLERPRLAPTPTDTARRAWSPSADGAGPALGIAWRSAIWSPLDAQPQTRTRRDRREAG